MSASRGPPVSRQRFKLALRSEEELGGIAETADDCNKQVNKHIDRETNS